MDVYKIELPEGYSGPYTIIGYDGRDVVRLKTNNGLATTFPTADPDDLVCKDETGTYQPIRRKQLQKFRGECG